MPATLLVILPDTTPLVLLAAADALDVLSALGRVVVPDVVRLEATRRLDKPWARQIDDWLSRAGIEIAVTEWGDLYRLAIEQGRKPPRNAGEISLLEWLHDHLTSGKEPALVVSEDLRVPRMMAREAFKQPIPVLTTFNLLELAEEQRIICSAQAVWRSVLHHVPTAGTVRPRSDRSRTP